MRRLTARLIVPVLCVAAWLQPAPARAQAIDDAFRADIEKLLEVTSAAPMGSQAASMVFGQVVAGLKKSQPQIPDRALDVTKEVFDAEFAKAFTGPDGLTAQMIGIYAKYFTHDDVRALI